MFASVVDTLGANGIEVDTSMYLDLNVNRLCIFQIITGLSLILCTIYFAMVAKRTGGRKEELKSPVLSFMSALLIVTLAMLIYLLNMT